MPGNDSLAPRRRPVPSGHEGAQIPERPALRRRRPSPRRLLDAYGRGIFPWFSEGDPILWWSPAPRMVLFPDELRVSRSLRKSVQRGTYEIRFDTAFRDVITACAEPRDGQAGTWILPEM